MPPVTSEQTVLQTTIRVLIEGQEVVNVLHWRDDRTFTNELADALLDTAAQAVGEAWSVHMMPHLSTEAVLTSVDARRLDHPTIAPQVRTYSVAGDRTGKPFPQNAAVCLNLRTLLAGRSGRGRVFVGGISIENNAAPSQGTEPIPEIRADLETSLEGVAEDVRTALDGDVWLAVWSRKLDAINTVQNVTASRRWATQRRRLR